MLEIGWRGARGHQSRTLILRGPRLRASRGHPLAHHLDPRGRSDTWGSLRVHLIRGVRYLSLAAEREVSHHRPPVLNSGELVRRPWDLTEGLASRCSGHFWLGSRIEQVRYGSSLNAVTDLCVPPASLPQPRQHDGSATGAGGGSVGTPERENAGVRFARPVPKVPRVAKTEDNKCLHIVHLCR